MKKLVITLCLAIIFAVPAWSQSCPHPNTQLSAGTNSKTMNGNGRQSVGSFSAELWADGSGTMNMTAYGDNGGGSAFKANWGNAGDFLARVGYYWGNGGKYTSYNNICADYNYVKTGSAGGYNYIGVYGWTKSPTIEYYIVDDWWGDNRGISDIEGQIKGGGTNFTKKGSFTVDGASYNVYQNQRNNAASINGNETFQQYFSVRASRRTCGTISVTEHFKKWAEFGMSMGNMYEASITVEAGGGTGSIDYRYGKMSQVTGACGGTSGGTSSNSTGGTPSSSSAAKTQATTCKTPLITYPTSTVPTDPYTACFKYTNNKCYVCKVENEGDGNTCASGWVWDGTQIDNNIRDKYWYYEVTCPATSSSSAAVSSSSRASSSSVAAAVSSSSRANSSSATAAVSSSSRSSSSATAAAVSSSSRANSSSAVASSSSIALCPPGSPCPSSSSSAEGLSSSSEDPTPILGTRLPVTYFSIQPQSGKALRIEISSPAVVEIFDLKGNKVQRFNVSSTQQTVNLSSPSGIYFAKVHGMKSIRFVLK